MNEAELREEIFRLAGELARGEWSAQQSARLAELLRGSAEARRLWFQFHDLDLGLADWAAAQGTRPVALRAEPALPMGSWFAAVQRYGLAAAVAAMLTLGAVWLADRKSEVIASVPLEYVATLAGQQECVWKNGAALTTGRRMAAGTLSLTSGRALLHFDGGARVAVIGPAELLLESPGAARVVAGKVAVHAPEEAVGFRLTTAQGTAVDLGTEFVVAVNARGEAECQVLEGEVEWHSSQPAQKLALLSQGEARRFVDGRAEEIATATGRFADFVPRAPADAAGELLAYEPFDYAAADLPVEDLAGGIGWRASWRGRFVITDNVDADARMQFEPGAGLSAKGLAAGQGGSLVFGAERLYRLRALPAPLDFARDGVHYFSFLMRVGEPLSSQGRQRGPMRLEFRSSQDYWTRCLGFSLGTVGKPVVFADGNNSAGGTPLAASETVFVVGKIATSRAAPDQMFLRVYAPDEVPDAAETTRWTVASRDLDLDCALDYLILAMPRSAGGRFDELRHGTSWRAVVPVGNAR